MKSISRALLAALAFSIAAVPMAGAQSRDQGSRHGHHYTQPAKPGWQAPRHYEPQKRRHHWKKGQRVSDWKRRPAVRDWHRYDLKRPARGQQWVRVDRDYLLISMATGVVLGVIAGR
jgi:Ni/Co efflux regulator RcnB